MMDLTMFRVNILFIIYSLGLTAAKYQLGSQRSKPYYTCGRIMFLFSVSHGPILPNFIGDLGKIPHFI